VLRDHSSVGLAAALFKESIRRVAMIGTTNWFILLDTRRRQSLRGSINGEGRNLRCGKEPECYLKYTRGKRDTVNDLRAHTTYRAGKEEQQRKELDEKHDYEVYRRISQNYVPEGRYPQRPGRQPSPDAEGDSHKGNDIYNVPNVRRFRAPSWTVRSHRKQVPC
jgi:hypothetical protein